METANFIFIGPSENSTVHLLLNFQNAKGNFKQIGRIKKENFYSYIHQFSSFKFLKGFKD